MTREEEIFLESVSHKVNDVSGIDIKEVFRLAKIHLVLPLVYENLCGARGFDENAYPKLRARVFSMVYAQAKRTAQFKKIYKELLDNGIKPIVVKGIICRQLYGELCDHRPSSDEDILIKRDDYFKAHEVFAANGYYTHEKVDEKVLEHVQQITFYNEDTKLTIELHLNLIGNETKLRHCMNEYFSDAFSSCTEIEIDGQKYYTLGYTENYIFLFYHLFKHFSTSGVGVRQMLDMLKFAQVYGDNIDQDKVREAVLSIKTSYLYGDIIEIGNRYMGFSLENKFGVTHPERLLEDMFFSGIYGNGTSEQSGSKIKVIMAMDSGGRMGRLRTLFPPVGFMREYYKVLNRYPFLLPLMWVVRIVRYIFRRSKCETYDVLKSDKLADKRIRLLKDYNII